MIPNSRSLTQWKSCEKIDGQPGLLRWRSGRSRLRSPSSHVALGAAACGGERRQRDSTVYSGREEELVAPSARDASRRRPATSWRSATATPPSWRRRSSRRATAAPPTSSSPRTPGSLGALEKEGLLGDAAAGRPRARSTRAFRSATGNWVGTSGRARVIAYDSRGALARPTCPTRSSTSPTRSGRAASGWAPTNASFQAFVTAMRVTEGEDAARDVAGGHGRPTTRRSTTSNAAIRDAIAAARSTSASSTTTTSPRPSAEEGADYPVDVSLPRRRRRRLAGQRRRRRHPGELRATQTAARELVDFLLSREASAYFADETKEYPLVDGVEADPGARAARARSSSRTSTSSDLDDLQGTLDAAPGDRGAVEARGQLAAPGRRRRPGAARPAAGRAARRWASSWRVAAALPLAYLADRHRRRRRLRGPRRDLAAAHAPSCCCAASRWPRPSPPAAIAIAVPLAWLTIRTDLPGRRLWAVRRGAAARHPQLHRRLRCFSPRSGRAACSRTCWRRSGSSGCPRSTASPAPGSMLTLFTYPFVLLPVRAALPRLDPQLEEAARGMGAARPGRVPHRRPAAARARDRRRAPCSSRSTSLSDFGAVSIMRFDSFTTVDLHPLPGQLRPHRRGRACGPAGGC